MKMVLFAAAVALAGFSAAPALAQSEPISARVRYADLDLGSRAGAKTMLRRIENAAERVCGNRPALRDIRAFSRFRACVEDAESTAVAQLNSPLVTALFEEREPRIRLATATPR